MALLFSHLSNIRYTICLRQRRVATIFQRVFSLSKTIFNGIFFFLNFDMTLKTRDTLSYSRCIIDENWFDYIDEDIERKIKMQYRCLNQYKIIMYCLKKNRLLSFVKCSKIFEVLREIYVIFITFYDILLNQYFI